MHVVRFTDAPSYEAPGHDRMTMVRLQGREAGPSDTAWLGISTLEPGGGTTLDASSVEKLYVVLDGRVTVSNGQEEAVLHRWDFLPHRARRGPETLQRDRQAGGDPAGDAAASEPAAVRRAPPSRNAHVIPRGGLPVAASCSFRREELP